MPTHAPARTRHAPTAALVLLALSTGTTGLAADDPGASPVRVPPVLVSFVSHNEENQPFVTNRTYYLQNRVLLKQLAETITRRGATYNFQSDWAFLRAVALYDDKTVKQDTDGLNIVRWLSEQPGVEVDPHAHENVYNYADVAALIEGLGVTPSKTVGGFLYYPAVNPQGWEQHQAGIYGVQFPSYFWRAEILWGAATSRHQGPDEHGSGVWRPQDRDNFTMHDPGQRLVYVGTCGGPVSQEQAVLDLLAAIDAGQAPSTGFYTATIMIAQGSLSAQDIASTASFIDSLRDEVLAGKLRFVTLSQAVALWTSTRGGRAFRYDCDTGQVTINEVPMPTLD